MMTQEEKLDKLEKELARTYEYVLATDRRLALLQKEFRGYDKEYKAYIAKKYRVKDRLYGLYHRLRYGKYPDAEKRTARRMARVFYRGSQI